MYYLELGDFGGAIVGLSGYGALGSVQFLQQ